MITELTIFMSGGGCQTAYGKLADGNYFACMLFDDVSLLDAPYEYGYDADWFDAHHIKDECNTDEFYKELCEKAVKSNEEHEVVQMCQDWLKENA